MQYSYIIILCSICISTLPGDLQLLRGSGRYSVGYNEHSRSDGVDVAARDQRLLHHYLIVCSVIIILLTMVNNNHHHHLIIMCSFASTGIDLDTTDNTSPSDLLSRLSFDRKPDPHQSSDSIVNSMNNPLMMSQHSGTVSLSDGHLWWIIDSWQRFLSDRIM